MTHTDKASTATQISLANAAKWTAVSVLSLVILCVVWESIGAPIKPLDDGFPWLALKGALLVPLLPRLYRGERRAFQILTLLILLYSTEGWVRAFSDINPTSRIFAWVEIVLSLIIFIQANWYARRTRVIPENTPVKQRKPRPNGTVQLMMYLYATLLCFTGMSFLYTPDGSESAVFYQVIWLIRIAFILLNLWLLFGLIRQGRQRAKTAQSISAHSKNANDHESA